MITYRRDVPAGSRQALEDVIAHVRAHLSAVAAEDDDPETNADDVSIEVRSDPRNPDMISVIGVLDAEPSAPYLQSDYDPDSDHSDIVFSRFETDDL